MLRARIQLITSGLSPCIDAELKAIFNRARQALVQLEREWEL